MTAAPTRHARAAYDVIGLGWALLDTTMELSTFPGEDTKTKATGCRSAAGGPALRALVALSRLGHRGALVAAVGADPAGAAVASQLRDEHVSDQLLVTLAGTTRSAHVWVCANSGSRTIAYADSLPQMTQLPEQTLAHITRAGALLLDGRDGPAAMAAARAAREGGALVCVDVGGSRKAGIRELVALADVVVGPGSALAGICDAESAAAAAVLLLRAGTRLVVATGGSSGATGYDAGGQMRQRAFDVAVVDSNGAGDSFHGGLVAGLLDGQSHSGALSWAAAVAALKVSQPGDGGLPSRTQLNAFLAAVPG